MADISSIKLPDNNKYVLKASKIPYAELDSTSTDTVMTASVDGITELKNGVLVYLRNNVITSAANFTLNINDLGAKPVYSSLAAASRSSTVFNVNYTMMFIYNENRVSGGCWDCFYGYDSNTNTIGYQLRTNSQSLPMKSVTYRYRLLFTSADGNYFVPANNSTSTNATASRTVCQNKINPFGNIYYYGTTASVAADSRPSASYLWRQYTLSLGYSFNRTGAALVLTTYTPVYVKCAPQTDGSAIIDSTTPYVQALPTTEDGYIYIFLGIAYSATNIELVPEHPVYYYKDGQIRLYTNQVISGSSVSPYTSNPAMDRTASAGSSDDYARGDHVHPSDTSRVPTSRKVNGKALSSDITLSASDVNALPSSTSIPTKVSDLTNDSGYITGIDSSDVTTALGYTPYNQTNPDGYISTETDPTVPAWAKESSKPTYTYSEITNTPTLATVATSGSYNDLSDTPDIPSDKVKLINVTITSIDPVIVGVSDTTSGDILTATTAGKLCVVKTSLGTTVMTAPLSLVDANAQDGAVAIFTYEDQSNPTYKYCTMTIVGTNVTFTFKDGYATTSQIPTKTSDLTNDSGFITDAGVTSFNGSTGAITYNAPVTSVNGNTGAVTVQSTLVSGTNIKTINNESLLGSGNIAVLTSYTETDPTVPSWAKASTKPTYTASEVGALASSGDTDFTGANNVLALKSAVATNSPILRFQRGELNDNYNDWQIQDRSGFLYFDERGNGSTSWTNRVSFNTSGNVQATTFNGYSLAGASAKSVDTSISAGSTSANLPTSQAVASFVEGKGYITSAPVSSVNGNTGAVTVRELPSVTTSDNGKVLRVVNGAWTAVSLPSASGESF